MKTCKNVLSLHQKTTTAGSPKQEKTKRKKQKEKNKKNQEEKQKSRQKTQTPKGLSLLSRFCKAKARALCQKRKNISLYHFVLKTTRMATTSKASRFP